MPTYAYTCTVCGHSFDVHQSFDDAPLTVCPECSGRLRKVFSPVGVVFKGSGFYHTDARSSGKAGAGTTTPSSSSGGSSAGSSSGESSSSGTTSTTSPTTPAKPSSPTTSTAKAAAGS